MTVLIHSLRCMYQRGILISTRVICSFSERSFSRDGRCDNKNRCAEPRAMNCLILMMMEFFKNNIKNFGVIFFNSVFAAVSKPR